MLTYPSLATNSIQHAHAVSSADWSRISAGFSFAVYIGDPDGDFDFENPAAEVTGFSIDPVLSPAGADNFLPSLFGKEAVVSFEQSQG